MMLEICQELRNFFCRDCDKHFGRFTIERGNINCDFLKEGQFFRIVGSTLNDGIYKYPAVSLMDEEFNGSVWEMKCPPSFISLAGEIEAWQRENGGAVSAPFASESFGGYSYSKNIGAGDSWRTAFRTRLNAWRKV